jgi:hypothetical protein
VTAVRAEYVALDRVCRCHRRPILWGTVTMNRAETPRCQVTGAEVPGWLVAAGVSGVIVETAALDGGPLAAGDAVKAEEEVLS